MSALHLAPGVGPLRALRRLRLVSSHLTRTTTALSALAPSLLTAAAVPRSSLPTRQFSTSSTSSSSSSASTDSFSFTTACAFRGKPGSPEYSPESATSSQDQPKRKTSSGLDQLQQGLARDHPLSQWRDAQLERSPKGAGHDWFFIEGIPAHPSQGESLHPPSPDDNVRVGGINGVVLAVADGVGGWEESGVDPSHFSQALMWFARERVRQGHLSESTIGSKALKALLEGAFEDVTNEDAIVAGSSTACLVALDSSNGKLHAANLGDSSYMILRPEPRAHLPTPPASPQLDAPSTPTSTAPMYTVVHSEPSQTHFFNAPYQLSKLPPSQRQQQTNSLMDSPADAAVTPREGIQLQVGDIVVLSTDGFGDNVFPEEMQQLVGLVYDKCLETQQQGQTSSGGPVGTVMTIDDHLFASSLAQTSLNFARLVSFKRDKVTPFEVEARRYGYGKGSGLGGGKVDDITVVVAVVGKPSSPES
ncbi:uncharacterized protein JCM15063_001519 [Sporobolomyces koalae]|uniref:uncharacterized protein n=1 Tax=Sporobolomyces koalae TaxID=500713 RepID=UPI003177EAFE